jgi:uncharacterized damage-inducible protein DinB
MSLKPDQALFLLNCMLPTLQNEHRITRAVLDAIPVEKAMEYRPDAVSKSAFDLAWHIAATENVFLKAVSAGAFDFAPQTKPQSMAELISFFDETYQKNIAAIQQLTGEQLATIIDFRGMFKLAAVEYLGFSNSHSIHHRGQLSMYLRPMGAKVPSMYGESYDGAQARQSAATARA